MVTRWSWVIAVSCLLGCTEPVATAPKAAAEKPTHFASDLEQGLDKARALQDQLEQADKARANTLQQLDAD